MAQLGLSVPNELAEAVRAHNIPVSLTCQRALARQVRIRERQAVERNRQLALQTHVFANGGNTHRPAS